MTMKTRIEIDAGRRIFSSVLLPELIAALRCCRPGDLLAVIGREADIGADLETWCRFTRNTLIDTTTAAATAGASLHRITQRVRRIANEAAELGVSEIFVTGGEPFLLPDLAEILAACAATAATTVLTNGMLLAGRRLETLRSLPRDRVTLQISLDSPEPARHDRHRGRGTWARAWSGIERARAEEFRVRLAATVSTDTEAEEFRRFLDAQQIPDEDRVVRHIALRGFATRGIALARADLVPEITITADGVYWHPVGAEDADLLVTSDIFPLADAFAAVRRAFDRESEHQRRLARIFNCA